MKLGFIGFGNMAQAMAEAFRKYGGMREDEIVAFAPNTEKLAQNAKRIGAEWVANVNALVESADVVILACKPYQIDGVLAQIGTTLGTKPLLSVAAGWSFHMFAELLPEGARVQCIMPNTPVSVGKGTYLLEEENSLQTQTRAEIVSLLEKTGVVVELPSKLMNTGSALSGCGPALFDLVVEALGDGGVKNGLPRQKAYQLVCGTMAGAAELLMVSGEHPGQLKDKVCSPGGTTIKGIATLEKYAVRSAFIEAVDKIVKG